MIRLHLILLFLACSTSAISQRLGRFAGPDESGITMGYTHIKNYFGFIDKDSVCENKNGEKDVYFLFFQLSDTMQNFGVRIVNPVPEMCFPDKGDIVSDNYYEHEKEKSGRWNTWISLERKIGADWFGVASNDDGNEVPGATNSIIRISNKKDKLPPGNYRIVISSSKPEKIQGGFVVQVGSMKSVKMIKFSPIEE